MRIVVQKVTVPSPAQGKPRLYCNSTTNARLPWRHSGNYSFKRNLSKYHPGLAVPSGWVRLSLVWGRVPSISHWAPPTQNNNNPKLYSLPMNMNLPAIIPASCCPRLLRLHLLSKFLTNWGQISDLTSHPMAIWPSYITCCLLTLPHRSPSLPSRYYGLQQRFPRSFSWKDVNPLEEIS